jgi:hypothetical protein
VRNVRCEDRRGARTLRFLSVSCQKRKGHFFLCDRHTIFYVYYKRDQSNSKVSVRSFIRRDP